ncbi:hypothetical protein [Sivoneniella epilithica]
MADFSLLAVILSDKAAINSKPPMTDSSNITLTIAFVDPAIA